MASITSPEQYAGIAVSQALASELAENAEISGVIKELRLQRKKLREICDILQDSYAHLCETNANVLISAVSRAIYQICGDELAAQISKETHVVPKVPYLQGTTDPEERRRVSVAGVQAQGKHVWSAEDDSSLASSIASAEEKLKGRHGSFWNTVSENMKEKHSIEVSASACRNREKKILKRNEKE